MEPALDLPVQGRVYGPVMSTTSPGLAAAVEALADAFIPMTEAEQRLITAGYRLLSDGVPVEVEVLARSVRRSPGDVEGSLRSWPGVYLDGDGRLIGLWGMAVTDVSPHRARFGDRGDVWMWCALDPLFIAPLLAEPVAVRSGCPTTGEPIRLTVNTGGVVEVDPPATVVSFLLPDGPFDAEVRQTFCHFVHLFVSPAAADAWTATYPGTFWVPVADAIEVGRQLAGRAFPALSQH